MVLTKIAALLTAPTIVLSAALPAPTMTTGTTTRTAAVVAPTARTHPARHDSSPRRSTRSHRRRPLEHLWHPRSTRGLPPTGGPVLVSTSTRHTVKPSVSRSSPRRPSGVTGGSTSRTSGLTGLQRARSLPEPWRSIVRCESLGDGSWREGSSSRARGFFQFLRSTWRSLGLSGDPAAAPFGDQYDAARRLARRDGLGAWDCARILGWA